MSKASYDKALQAWANTWRDENLSEDVRRLITQANFDLYYGPDGETRDEELAKYPGFVTACRTIREALEELPSTIYIDIESDEVSESEPEPTKCEACDGEGRLHLGEHEGPCLDCAGQGMIEPAGEWWKVERPDIRKVLLGTELAASL